MTTCVYVGASLDGFIATPDGGLEWLSEYPDPDGGDLGFSDFMQQIDLVVMGRNTFETVLSFGEWPYSVPVWILSRTIHEVPSNLAGAAEVLNLGPGAVLARASEAGQRRIYVDGGQVIREFLKLDLVDEMVITWLPVLLGSGIPLFTELSHPVRFTLNQSEVLAGELVKSSYVRKR